MKNQPSSSHRRGFTLIELLVVIAIIVILAGLSAGGYAYVARKQADSQADVQINLLSKALEEYKLDNGAYPETGSDQKASVLYPALYSNGLGATPTGKIYLADLDPSTKNHGWIDATGGTTKIVDPWGNQYIYRRGDHSSAKNPDFDLASGGKDGILGTADDIDNY